MQSQSSASSTATPLPEPASDRILDDIAVTLMTTLPRSTIVRLSHHGEFPRPVRLHTGRIGWRMSDIQHWITGLMPVGGDR
jgi:predicted DNA-binding transcriptional regulator AlpA